MILQVLYLCAIFHSQMGNYNTTVYRLSPSPPPKNIWQRIKMVVTFQKHWCILLHCLFRIKSKLYNGLYWNQSLLSKDEYNVEPKIVLSLISPFKCKTIFGFIWFILNCKTHRTKPSKILGLMFSNNIQPFLIIITDFCQIKLILKRRPYCRHLVKCLHHTNFHRCISA